MTPIIDAYSSTLRISTFRFWMKYVCLLFTSLARSLTACSFKLNKSATSCPVIDFYASIFTSFNLSATFSYLKERRFRFGLAGLFGGWASLSICQSCGVCYWFERDYIFPSSTATNRPESISYWPALSLKELLIFDAPLAYSYNYSLLIRWLSIVSWSCMLLNVSGSKSSKETSRTESLRTCLRLLSVNMSVSTSKMVIRWLMAPTTLLTRVQYIGLSNIRLDFEGK